MKFAKNISILFFLLFFFIFFNITTKSLRNPFGIDIDIESDAIYFINEDTNTIIFEKNKDLKIPCSALAKMMTTILILESKECKENPRKFLNRKITASPEIFDRLYLKGASNANLRKGETITVKDALFATMLQSACEATMMLVHMFVGQNTDAFVDMMNKKAKELKMENTNFVDPDGLDTTSQQTTAYDMYLLTKYCMKNSLFRKIATTTTYEIPPTNIHQNPTKLIHTNKMLSKFLGGKYHDERVKGIKTAKIDGKDNLVTVAQDKSYNYTLIILGAPKINNESVVYKEAKSLYNWAFKNLKLEIVAAPGEKTIPNNIQVNMSKNSAGIVLTPKEQVTILIPSNVDKSTIYWDLSDLPKTLDAPIKKGTEIGEVKLKLSDQEIGKVTVAAAQDVKADIFSFISSMVIRILTSVWFILSAIIITAIVVWLFINNKFKPKKKKNKNIKRYKPFH